MPEAAESTPRSTIYLSTLSGAIRAHFRGLHSLGPSLISSKDARLPALPAPVSGAVAGVLLWGRRWSTSGAGSAMHRRSRQLSRMQAQSGLS